MKQKSFLLRNPSFLLILLASFLSKFGDALMSITVLWGIYSITKSAIAVSLVTLAQVLPIIIFSIYSGIVVDRANPKRIMILSDVIRFILLILLTILWKHNIFGLLSIYSTIFLLSTVSSFFDPSYQLVIKKIIPSDDLLSANSWLQINRNVSSLLGLLLGGTLVALLGIYYSFFINALTFIISAVLITIAKIPKINRKKVEKKFFQELKDGIYYIRNNASNRLKQSLFYIIIINFSVAPLSILMTLIADSSGYDSFGLGVMNASLILGSILGASISKKMMRFFQSISIVPLFITLFSISTILPTFVMSLFLSSIFLFFSGIWSSLTLVFVNTFFQKDTDINYMGRISSFRSISLRVPPPVIAIIYGLMISKIGIFLSTIIVQIVTISLSIVIYFRYQGGTINWNSLNRLLKKSKDI